MGKMSYFWAVYDLLWCGEGRREKGDEAVYASVGWMHDECKASTKTY